MATRYQYLWNEWVKGLGLPAAWLFLALKVLLADNPLEYVTSFRFAVGACVTILIFPLLAYAMGRAFWSLGFGRTISLEAMHVGPNFARQAFRSCSSVTPSLDFGWTIISIRIGGTSRSRKARKRKCFRRNAYSGFSDGTGCGGARR